MSILALSGWGQPHDALKNIAPNATHLNYAHHNNVADAIADIADAAQNHNAIIGWSLGGQLAVRAIAAGVAKPEKLVLIAAPFQFVQSPENKIGMPRDQFEKFHDNYEKNPARTLAKAWELIAKGDANEAAVKDHISLSSTTDVLKENWLQWLNALDGFSANNLDFSGFPPTLLLHAKQDAVVWYAQAAEYQKRIPQVKHIAFDAGGHAPHWHNEQAVRSHIEAFLHV